MPRLPDTTRRALRRAYWAGAGLCVAVPLGLQIGLGRIVARGTSGPAPLAQELGYTFTGLTVLGVLGALRCSRNLKARLGAVPEVRPGLAWQLLLQAALLFPGAAFGLLVYGLGGPDAERYARTFLALPVVLFLALVPRISGIEKAGTDL